MQNKVKCQYKFECHIDTFPFKKHSLNSASEEQNGIGADLRNAEIHQRAGLHAWQVHQSQRGHRGRLG